MRGFAGTRLSTERNPTGEVIEKLRTYSTGAGVSEGLIFPQENRTVGRSKNWRADWERSWELFGNGTGPTAEDSASPAEEEAASGATNGHGRPYPGVRGSTETREGQVGGSSAPAPVSPG